MSKKRRTQAEKEVIKEVKHNTMAKVTGVDILNIRVEPNGEIITQVKRDDILKVVENKTIKDNDCINWYNVITPIGQEGWAMAQYLLVYEENKFEEL